MNHDELEQQILDAAEKATPGPWIAIDRHFEPRYVGRPENGEDESNGYDGICQPDRGPQDVIYIALANPANIRSLIEGYRDQLKTVLDRESASQKRHDDKLDELEAKIAQARKDVLEEAAKECDENALSDCSDTGETARKHDADSIRALIAKEPAKPREEVAKETTSE